MNLSAASSGLLCALFGLATVHCDAQALPTATRALQPTVFALVTGVATGMNSADRNQLRGGRNLSVTVGADLELYAVRHYFLAVEARGTYPLKSGKIVGERSVLAGLRLSRGVGENGRVRPYVDVLFGRGQMDYQRGGYVVPGFLYTRSSSNVFDGGAGVEFDVTDRFTFKVDGQVQHWSTPVLTSGSAYSKQVSVGVAYRIGAGGGPR